MPIPPNLYEKISQLVAENRVNSAIELLEEQLPVLEKDNPEQYHAALVLMQDFNEIQERKINGLLVAETETNSFSFRLLEFSRMLGRKFTPPPPPAASPDPLRVAQPTYSVPKSIPAASPTNAQPGSNANNSSGGGSSIGKLVMYGLAVLGLLAVIGLVIDTGDDYEDPSITEDPTPYATPTSETGTFSETIDPEDPEDPMMLLASILGNSYWLSSDYEETSLLFSEDGKTVKEDLFLGGEMRILSFEDDHYLATLTEDGSRNPGMTAWITFLGDGQQMQIETFEIRTRELLETTLFYRSDRN